MVFHSGDRGGGVKGGELHSGKSLAVVGFEPTPPRRLVPKTSALDRSATLPLQIFMQSMIVRTFINKQIFSQFALKKN